VSTGIEELINEVRLCYQSLVQIGDSIHAGSNVSMGMRAVLEYLDRNGDATVPDMARARRVTRQRIQSLVNSLADAGYVTTSANPASRRSPLITLTTAGQGKILGMRRLEGRHMRVGLSAKRIAEATATLAELRTSLEEHHAK